MKKQVYSIEDRISYAENDKIDWQKSMKYFIFICAVVYVLVSCNIGLKSTTCPSHNPNWASGGKSQKYYKH